MSFGKFVGSVGDSIRFEYDNGPDSLNPGQYSIREGVIVELKPTCVLVQGDADNYPKNFRYDRIGSIESR